jgi:hypothetical protein
MRTALVTLLFLSLALPAGAVKPEVLEEIDLLKKQAMAGDVPSALESARLIEAWLLEEQAGDLSKVFTPLAGWELEINDGQSAGAAMFGGGITSSATYTKGEESYDVTIIGNSPMFGMVSGIVGNAMMASSSGAKIVKINGMKASIREQSDEVEVTVPYKGNTIVTTKGPGRDNAVKITENLGWDVLGPIVETQ